MAAFEDRFYRENPHLLQRLARDLSLLRWLAGGLFAWAFGGRRLRKAYARAQEANDTVVLEDFIDRDEQ